MTDLVTTLTNTKMCNTLVQVLETTGIVDVLNGGEILTVFAPVDAAFANLPEGVMDRLLAQPNRLKKILLYHLVFGDVRAEDLLEIDEAPTVEGSVLAIDSSHGYQVNQANVITPDLTADNGVVHIIDSLLMPGIMEF